MGMVTGFAPQPTSSTAWLARYLEAKPNWRSAGPGPSGASA
jgi:hypothetical protein